MLRPTLPLLLSLSLPFLLGACQSLEFRDTNVVETTYDPSIHATKVVVQFQLLDSAGLPVSDLEPSSFTARENGIRTGEEAMPKAHRERHPIDVAVLLDRSASVYRGGLIDDLKDTAQRLTTGLAEHPCTVHLYSFGRTVAALDSLAELPDEPGQGEEHWTSLYHAVRDVLDRHPGGIVVVLTDGADNYSQNMGGPTLDELAQRIRDDKRIVHALGFGAVEKEYDRNGVSGASALRMLSQYGSYLPPPRPATAAGESKETADGQPAEASAEKHSTIDDIVAQVARRIPATYTYEFYSPNLAGEHSLQIEADWNGVRGTSPPMSYRGAGPRSGGKEEK